MFGNTKRKQNPSSDGRESVKLFGCQNSQYTKVNVCSFHYLKNGLSLSQFFPPFLSIVGALAKDCRQFSGPCRLSFLPLRRSHYSTPYLKKWTRPLIAGVVPSALRSSYQFIHESGNDKTCSKVSCLNKRHDGTTRSSNTELRGLRSNSSTKTTPQWVHTVPVIINNYSPKWRWTVR